MSWPELNRTCASSVGACGAWALPAIAPAAITKTKPTSRALILFSCSRLYPLLKIRFVQIRQRDPCEAHFIDRPLPVANPVSRIRVVFVVGRVVVPRRNVNDRSGRQQWGGVVGIWIRDMPPELIGTHTAERLYAGRA